jgi:four helix bundle suffix protein
MRPATADDAVAWAREVKESGRDGQHGRGGQDRPSSSTSSTLSIQSTSYSEIAANGALALIAVACSLLDRQIAALEKAFVTEGGFTERLYRVRTAERDRSGSRTENRSSREVGFHLLSLIVYRIPPRFLRVFGQTGIIPLNKAVNRFSAWHFSLPIAGIVEEKFI